jgi:hypothetical protein
MEIPAPSRQQSHRGGATPVRCPIEAPNAHNSNLHDLERAPKSEWVGLLLTSGEYGVEAVHGAKWLRGGAARNSHNAGVQCAKLVVAEAHPSPDKAPGKVQWRWRVPVSFGGEALRNGYLDTGPRHSWGERGQERAWYLYPIVVRGFRQPLREQGTRSPRGICGDWSAPAWSGGEDEQGHDQHNRETFRARVSWDGPGCARYREKLGRERV